jgi:hypothetical protein
VPVPAPHPDPHVDRDDDALTATLRALTRLQDELLSTLGRLDDAILATPTDREARPRIAPRDAGGSTGRGARP